MNRLSALLLIASIAFGCNKRGNLVGNTTIEIIGSERAQIRLIQPQLVDEPKTLFPSNKDRNKVLYQLETSNPVHLILLSPVRVSLLINSGDSLVLDVSKSLPKFSGIGAERQAIYYEFDQQLTRLSSKWVDAVTLSRELDTNEFHDEITNRDREIQKVAWGILQSQKNEDNLLASWINLTVQFIKANSLASYIQMRDEIDTDKLEAVVHQMLPLDPTILYLPQYATQWATIAKAVFVHKPLYEQGYFDESETVIMEEVIKFEADTVLKQLMMTSLLTKQLSSMDTSLFSDFRSTIESYLTIPELQFKIQSLHAEAVTQIKNADDLLMDSYIGDFNVNEVIKSIKSVNSGKVIYIDIWATWCKPCLAEFKETSTFKEQFKNEDITYVYVCAQSPKQESWKALVNKYDLKGTHLYLSNEQFSDFKELFPVGYFPSYYILDQKGEIVNKEANLSPSNPRTTKVIGSLL